MTDVCRTAEPLADWRMTLWLLSQRVVSLLAREKVTGVAFRPVLVQGTPLHSEYTRQWRELARLSVIGPAWSARSSTPC